MGTLNPKPGIIFLYSLLRTSKKLLEGSRNSKPYIPYMGGCQNFGRVFGTLDITRCSIIMGIAVLSWGSRKGP